MVLFNNEKIEYIEKMTNMNLDNYNFSLTNEIKIFVEIVNNYLVLNPKSEIKDLCIYGEMIVNIILNSINNNDDLKSIIIDIDFFNHFYHFKKNRELVIFLSYLENNSYKIVENNSNIVQLKNEELTINFHLKNNDHYLYYLVNRFSIKIGDLYQFYEGTLKSFIQKLNSVFIIKKPSYKKDILYGMLELLFKKIYFDNNRFVASYYFLNDIMIKNYIQDLEIYHKMLNKGFQLETLRDNTFNVEYFDKTNTKEEKLCMIDLETSSNEGNYYIVRRCNRLHNCNQWISLKSYINLLKMNYQDLNECGSMKCPCGKFYGNIQDYF